MHCISIAIGIYGKRKTFDIDQWFILSTNRTSVKGWTGVNYVKISRMSKTQTMKVMRTFSCMPLTVIRLF